jgi:hypothetical protein
MNKNFTYYVDENCVFEIYDKYDRKHFSSEITAEQFNLFLKDKLLFIKEMEDIFHDVFESLQDIIL